MNKDELKKLLTEVADGKVCVDNALSKIRTMPYEDLDFAKVDTHRSVRQGIPEVIYGEGKTKEQIRDIALSLLQSGEKTVLITRIDREKAEYLREYAVCEYHETPRICIAGERCAITGKGKIVVACAGTSDLYCAQEAQLTAEAFGNEVVTLFDVGVAGIHRLLEKIDVLQSARAVIAVAGMEGALASVVGGLVDCPVIAVPTSVGYGANFGGVSALLAMLNSCASNVSVVNIDNGFGAGYIASLINHLD